jgi:hypothetical protein
MLIAGGVSVIAGFAYVVSAAGDDPSLGRLTLYAATGGADFVIQAWLLARRRRRLAPVAA